MLFVASGPWINWDHSINDPKNGNIITWATNKSDGFYKKLKLGDTVLMANQPSPNNGPYSRKVIFGFGNVIKKYHETKKYWPDAVWAYRFDIQPTFVAETDENAFTWSTKLAPYGLRTIPDSNTVKKKLIEWMKKRGTNIQQSTFKFVRKDFRCKKEESDAKYRRGRFVELFDDMIPKLGPRFDEVKKDVGLSIQSSKRKFSYFGRHNKRGEKKYFDYTWLGIYIAQPPPNPTSIKSDFKYSAKDTIQFQVGLNPRDPIWAGLYIGRLPGVEQTRKRMLTLLEEQPKECLRMFKSLAEGYVIKIYGPVKKDDSSRLEGTWEISKLDEYSFNEILEKYSKKGTDFRICKFFTRKEALK